MNALVRPDHHRLAGLGLRIEHRRVDALVPYARNARTHSEAQVALIAGSIREFGFTSPLLVDGENGIIAGHGRLLAARKLGLAEVPVIELAHLSRRRSGRWSSPTTSSPSVLAGTSELLALEAGELAELGVDLSALGFEAGEIDDLLHGDPADPREEETPEPPVAPVSRPGDLWLMATAPGALRRRHGRRRRRSPARRRRAAAHGHRSALWRRVRPGLAQPQRRQPHRSHRQGAERRPGRLARGLGAVPRRRRLRLARCAACRHRGREPRRLRLRHPQPDHLGEGAAGALPRATTTGSTNHAGTRCEARRTGRAIASRPRSGRCRAGTRMPPPSTARRSPSS